MAEYMIQLYVIKFVSDLQQFSGSIGTLVTSTNKMDQHNIIALLLKVVLNTNNSNYSTKKQHFKFKPYNHKTFEYKFFVLVLEKHPIRLSYRTNTAV